MQHKNHLDPCVSFDYGKHDIVAQKPDDVQFGGSAMSWLGDGAK